MVSLVRIVLFAAALVSSAALAARAEMFTLTDTQGRSIQAEVISVENDIAKIKRADGIRFDLPLANLVEADRNTLRDWAKRETQKPLPAGAITVEASRAKFDTTKTESKVPYRLNRHSDGSTTTEYRTRVTAHEQWGYSLTVTNTTLRQIDDLRLEYRLFVGDLASSPSSSFSSPSTSPESSVTTLTIGTLKPRDKTILRTSALTLTKSFFKGSSAKSTGPQLRGVWVRVYRGQELVHESSTPESIRLTEMWSVPAPLNGGSSSRRGDTPR